MTEGGLPNPPPPPLRRFPNPHQPTSPPQHSPPAPQYRCSATIPNMTNDQLLTWLRQRLPQLEPGQLPDTTIDLHNPNLDLKDPNTLRQVVHAGLTVLAQTSPADDTRRTAADRLDQLRAAGRRARGRRIERAQQLRALQRPVRIIGLTPPLNSPPNVRIASAEELANVLPGIDLDGDAVYLIAP